MMIKAEQSTLEKLCNHKKMATFYLCFAAFVGVVAAIFSVFLRFYTIRQYDYFFALDSINFHGYFFTVYMILPALIGFSNWFLPLMIGSDDVAFKILNFIAFLLWLYSLIIVSLGVVFLLFFGMIPILGCFSLYCVFASFFVVQISFIFNFINFITTIFTKRGKDMPLTKMPIFVRSVLLTSFLGLISVPVTMAILVKYLLFDLDMQGWPSMMWFVSRFYLYVILLPCLGIISQIIATLTNSAIWLEKAVIVVMGIYAFFVFILLSNDLFGHESTRMSIFFFLIVPVLIAPMVFIMLCWVVSLTINKLNIQVPVLFVFAFIFTFCVGLFLTMNSLLSAMTFFVDIDQGYELRQFITRLHYLVSLSAVFAVLAAWYYWFPQMLGYTYRNLTAQVHFFLLFMGANIIFILPQIAEFFPNSYLFGNYFSLIITIGAFMVLLSILVFIYGIVETFLLKKKAAAPYDVFVQK